MSTFFSPFEIPASWSYSLQEQEIPAGLRYGGYKLRMLRATIGVAAAVRVPSHCVLRQLAAADGSIFVEIQPNALRLRRLAQTFTGGLPTFYFRFPSGTTLSFTNDYDSANAAVGAIDELANVTEVSIGLATQDRVTLDPTHWSSDILGKLPTAERVSWNTFTTAISAAFPATTRPVMLLEAHGAWVENARINIIYGSGPTSTTHLAIVQASDFGDLQNTVQRMNAADSLAMPIADLFSTATSFRLQPLVTSGTSDFQLSRLEDGLSSIAEIEVTPNNRHILFTNLHNWFNPQCAVPISLTNSPLQRYTRNNRLTPFVNGPAFFDDFFRELHAARNPQGGVHHTGWSLVHNEYLTEEKSGDPADLARTFKGAVEQIGLAGGSACVLPARFFDLNESASLVPATALIFLLINATVLSINAFGVEAVRTDKKGIVLLLISYLVVTVLVAETFSNDGKWLEQNKGANDEINALANCNSLLSAYPATVADNPDATSTSSWPFTTIFDAVRHFNVFHQKFSVVKNTNGFMAYCGGIDLNTDRIDDENHLADSPYHDVHAKIEGPAVRDMAITFEQRWGRDAGDLNDLAFSAPAASDLPTPGAEIVQVSRTYFKPSDSSRAFSFAPNGDRTLLETMLKGIEMAKDFIYIEDQYLTPPIEYRTALINKVDTGAIKKLIIVVPKATDQPFGDVQRMDFVNDLHAADTSGEIVQVGYPRRHYTVPNNDMRVSSGKLRLMEDMLVSASSGYETVQLGPIARLPKPPFWLSIQGEIMYVVDEDSILSGLPTDTKAFKVLRGTDIPIVDGRSVPAKGPKTSAHKKGAAATVIDLAGIYMHSKMMIVDDVFLGLGSANLNRRGFYSDGEANIYVLPEAMKARTDNPIQQLRQQLWAEVLNLPISLAGPLLRDPIAAADLFKRSSLAGNRFADLKARPKELMFGVATGDGLIANLLQGAGFSIVAANQQALFDNVVDPSSGVASETCNTI